MYIDDVVTLIVNAGVAVKGTSIFWSAGAKLPSPGTPQANAGFLTVVEIAGKAPWFMHTSTTMPGYEQPAVQVVARATTTGTATVLMRKAWTIFANPLTVQNFSVGSTYYLRMRVRQSPFELGADASGLYRYAFDLDGVGRPTLMT